MRRSLAAPALFLACAGCGEPSTPRDGNAAHNGAAPRATAPLPDVIRVRIETEAGEILLALDHKRAPVTTENFVRYAHERRFDGTFFYRAARSKAAAGRGFVQGGIRHSYRKMLPPIAHEPTSKTGILHKDGTISMARAAQAGAMGDFFIVAGGAMPDMDAKPGKPDTGFAAFGRVEQGMNVVRKILAAPTVAAAGRGAMRGQMIAKPVKIVKAERAD
jgi:peptidyl-prolyl cis-trans isomerase A (cyclophilin A)